jgi:hypothetical protein
MGLVGMASAAETCDRMCLEGFVNQYLAVVAQYPSNGSDRVYARRPACFPSLKIWWANRSSIKRWRLLNAARARSQQQE